MLIPFLAPTCACMLAVVVLMMSVKRITQTVYNFNEEMRHAVSVVDAGEELAKEVSKVSERAAQTLQVTSESLSRFRKLSSKSQMMSSKGRVSQYG